MEVLYYKFDHKNVCELEQILLESTENQKKVENLLDELVVFFETGNLSLSHGSVLALNFDLDKFKNRKFFFEYANSLLINKSLLTIENVNELKRLGEETKSDLWFSGQYMNEVNKIFKEDGGVFNPDLDYRYRQEMRFGGVKEPFMSHLSVVIEYSVCGWVTYDYKNRTVTSLPFWHRR